MKTIFIFFIAILLPQLSYSQIYFQKINTGPIVNTMNYNHVTAWGDYDNDGDQDLVVTGVNDNCLNCDIPLLFFRNDGSGNFTRIYDNAIALTSMKGSGLAWGDYDNDGWLDLFICGTINARNKLFHNDQNGNFTEVLSGEIVTEINSSQTCGWTDYNKDGWLDLFVTNRYMTFSNRLYKNNGDGTFTKVLTGSIVNDIGESRGCAWGDYDNDGWPDLFVVNYAGQNDFLYRNDQDGSFTRILDQPMVNDGLWGSCAEWIDHDNNGYFDLYVTNNDGSNKLYINHGDGNFSLNNTLISQDGISYGFTWGDYDNDGYTDLFTCGKNAINKLYRNNGESGFTRITNEVVAQDGPYSVTSSFVDYNLDGKLDLIVANRFGNLYNYLYKNTGNTGNFITLKLRGCSSNKNGIGSKITVVTGITRQYKEISSGSAWDSESSLWPHFGIGNNQIVDSIIVLWPSNEITRYSNVSANQIVEIDECLGIIGITEGNTYLYNYKLTQNYPNPFNPVTNIEFEISDPGFVSLKIFDIQGKEIISLLNEIKPAGIYKVIFDGRDGNGNNLSSGIYFYTLRTDRFTETKRMILLK